MRRHFHIAAVITGLLGCVASSTTEAVDSNATRQPDLVYSFDHYLDSLHKRAWELHERSAALGKDRLGRSADDDLRDFGLSASEDSRLHALRTELQSAVQDPGADAAAKSAAWSRIATEERTATARLQFVLTYWFLQGGLPVHRALLTPLLGIAPADLRDVTLQREQTSEEAFDLKYAPSVLMSGGESQIDWRAATKAALDVLNTYNEMRETLVNAIAVEEPARLPDAIPRRDPCPAPSGEYSTRQKPALDPHRSAPIDSFYPEAMRAAGVNGLTTLTATVSSTGCMLTLVVKKTSGVPELDAAAIAWTQRAAFLPVRSADAQASPLTTTFNVRFGAF